MTDHGSKKHVEITLHFEDEKLASAFVAWFLDGDGESGFNADLAFDEGCEVSFDDNADALPRHIDFARVP